MTNFQNTRRIIITLVTVIPTAIVLFIVAIARVNDHSGTVISRCIAYTCLTISSCFIIIFLYEKIFVKKDKINVRNTAVSVLAAVLLIANLSCGMFIHRHRTHYRYDDDFILGNTSESIVKKYGAFDSIISASDSADQKRKASYITLLNRYKYTITFNEEGKAEKIELKNNHGG